MLYFNRHTHLYVHIRMYVNIYSSSRTDGLLYLNVLGLLVLMHMYTHTHLFTAFFTYMMMIAFITIKRSLVPLIEGLCAQIFFRFEIPVVCSHLLLFFFVKEYNMLKENKKAVSPVL